jgi:hypothetical protein
MKTIRFEHLVHDPTSNAATPPLTPQLLDDCFQALEIETGQKATSVYLSADVWRAVECEAPQSWRPMSIWTTETPALRAYRSDEGDLPVMLYRRVPIYLARGGGEPGRAVVNAEDLSGDMVGQVILTNLAGTMPPAYTVDPPAGMHVLVGQIRRGPFGAPSEVLGIAPSGSVKVTAGMSTTYRSAEEVATWPLVDPPAETSEEHRASVREKASRGKANPSTIDAEKPSRAGGVTALVVALSDMLEKMRAQPPGLHHTIANLNALLGLAKTLRGDKGGCSCLKIQADDPSRHFKGCPERERFPVPLGPVDGMTTIADAVDRAKVSYLAGAEVMREQAAQRVEEYSGDHHREVLPGNIRRLKLPDGNVDGPLDHLRKGVLGLAKMVGYDGTGWASDPDERMLHAIKDALEKPDPAPFGKRLGIFREVYPQNGESAVDVAIRLLSDMREALDLLGGEGATGLVNGIKRRDVVSSTIFKRLHDLRSALLVIVGSRPPEDVQDEDGWLIDKIRGIEVSARARGAMLEDGPKPGHEPRWLMQERSERTQEWLKTVNTCVKDAADTRDTEWERVLKSLANDFDTEVQRLKAARGSDNVDKGQIAGESLGYQRARNRVLEVLAAALPKPAHSPI